MMRHTHQQRCMISYGMLAVQVCASTACFGFVSEISHEQLFTAACLFLRAIMGEHHSTLHSSGWCTLQLCQGR